jgi:hypothetical protein
MYAGLQHRPILTVILVFDMRKPLIFLFIFIPLMVLGQEPHPLLQSFSAIKQPNGVFLKWVIKGGNQCNGTKVYRAKDYLNFEQINHLPGICGSFTENETYSYFDSVPHSNSYNHYRLEMGFQGFTDTVTVFFEDFGRADHVILSDHISNLYSILFSNDLKRKVLLQIFDTMGHVVWTETTTESHFLFRPRGLKGGVHLFRISGASSADIHGKFYFGGK